MRLKEDQNSWRAGGIKRRDFRHDPGMPETEVPRHTGYRRKKKKHVHEYVGTFLGYYTQWRHYHMWDKDGNPLPGERREDQVPKWIYTCKGCGHKRSSPRYW